MLQINHLTKIYSTKGGADVKALDNVSISFAETGLVFLLGKSGSGKSTLLNVAGGLDEPTSGEIIVKGKSSRSFTGSDFDSYRNTYVGFIFQEYNVLNEFNVEDNVALALELQGKPKNREKIYSILRDVELEAYAKRKPNTLSGGQKQRIAIARALVKDPQIIMADEPTGALDSGTGKQVFETLKKLSSSRLVIVVSHDREFAEIYGDRIVELQDGKIISDVTKVKEAPAVLEENLTRIGENILSVKCGTKLTKQNIQTIEKFLSENEGELIISRGERENNSFRKANRIDGEGARERFDETETDKLQLKTYQPTEAKFIRSRLPASKALKIGASGLKLKPFRLILTVFLSCVAFVMFGLFSTMMLYNGEEVLARSFMESDYQYLTLSKFYQTTTTVYQQGEEPWEYVSEQGAFFTEEEITQFTQDTFGAYGCNYSPVNVSIKTGLSNYYLPQINKLSVLPQKSALRNTLTGSYPQKDNEICISTYLLECIQNGTFRTVNDKGEYVAEKSISSAADLLGESLLLNGVPFRVTGIFDSGTVPAKYDDLKTEGNGITYFMYMQYIAEGLHSCAFVSEAFLKTYGDLLASPSDPYEEYFDYGACNLELVVEQPTGSGLDIHYPLSTNAFAVYPAEKMPPVTLFEDRQQLTEHQLIIPLSCLYTTIALRRSEEMDEELSKALAAMEVILSEVVFVQTPEDFIQVPATEQQLQEAHAQVKAFAAAHAELFTLKGFLDGIQYNDFEIVGYFLSPYEGVFCSQQLYDEARIYNKTVSSTKYTVEQDAKYAYLIMPFLHERQAFDELMEQLGSEHINEQTDVYYELYNSLYDNVIMANILVDTLSQVFLGIGIVLAVFSSLLLFNFISMSITNKKKEIGILRAVGARGLDVFKIFFAESGIIVGTCTVLALIGTMLFTNLLNNILKVEAGLDVALFVFGGFSVLTMVIVALFVAFISTFLPVWLAARKKPVESIRAL